MTAANIHPSAIVESEDVGGGTVVWAFVHVMEGAVIGNDCKLGDHTFIESGAVLGNRVTVKNNSLIWHGVTIGDDAFIGPNVVFTNDLRPRAHEPFGEADIVATAVDAGVSVGANCTIIGGITLARHSMIGAGSVVIRDVRKHELVVGNPARHIGWVCYCGSQLSAEMVCRNCGRSYEEEDSGLTEVGGE